VGPRTHFTRAEDDKEAKDMRIKQKCRQDRKRWADEKNRAG